MALEFLDNQTVLVTGGTGSFGQKFVKTLLDTSNAAKIIVFSRDEFKQSQMMSSIKDPAGRLRYFLGDVRDLERLQRAFHKVDVVVHAAALKQVPMLEYNPFEAVKTNIMGTQNVISAAVDQGVKKVVLVSTDKAANPANLYGATKLCAERLMIAGNAYGAGQTAFSVVRYGNVLGSRGSLLHIIEDQRAAGVIKLTHEEMTRFWITLQQGVELVLLALKQMKGGESFIPKVPSLPVKDFIKLVAPECKIEVVGIRPGEKLHEVLVTEEEARHALEFSDHYVVLPENPSWKHRKDYEAAGKPLPKNFSLRSDTNKMQLDAAGFEELIKSI